MPHYENVLFEVPDNWVWTTLEEICLFLSRGKSPKYSDTDKTYPVFAQKCNLKEGGISLEQARFLDPSTICKWSEEYKLKTGDVLVNSTGTGTVGRTRLFHESYLKHYPFVVPDSHVSVIRTASEIKSEFVFAYISSRLIQEYLEDNLAGSTNQKELYIGVLSDLLFPLPPLAEQQRIVTEIEKWFALIDEIEQGKADLQTSIKQTKSKILDLAIHGKLVPQDPSDEPASELLKRINPKAEITCDNGHYENLPDSWYLTDIKSIFTINPKNKVADDVIAGFVPMTNIADGYSNEFRCESKLWGDIKKGFTHFAEGDIVVAKISPCLENRKSVIVTSLPNGIGAGTTELFVFRSQCVLAEYGLYFFKSDLFINHCVGTFNGVVGQQRISKSIIESIKFPLPPISEQKRIVDAIHTVFSKLDTIMEGL
jgi:type I restriction enzyme S subunit